MKKFLFAFFLLSMICASANAVRSDQQVKTEQNPVTRSAETRPSDKKMDRKERRMRRMIEKRQARADRKSDRRGWNIADPFSRLLLLSAGLLVASILLFAFATGSTIVSILGSLALIGAVVFFILWLQKYTARKAEMLQEGETD